MRFGSVCSGIEAASVAWHTLGWEPAWLAEVDVPAATVLAHRLGATAPVFPLPKTEKAIAKIQWGDRLTNWGDMTKLVDLVRAGRAEAPDVFCGGTPCQDFSVAGLRKGLEGGRGNLTLSFIEIANEIDNKRAENGDEPCIIFWENVPGVLSDKTNAFGCLLAGLAGESVPLEPSGKRWTDAGLVVGPQRAVAWRTLDAQYFGLAQRRKRVFVVASAREGFDPGSVLFEFDGLRRDSAPSREAWKEVADLAAQGVDCGDREGFYRSHWDGRDEPHPTLNQSTNSGGVGLSNQELFSQRGAYLVADGHETRDGGRVAKALGLIPQWWDGRDVSQTLDAVLHKGQTMPEKDRFPAVLQPVAFDTTQITHPENRSNPKPGDPCHPLAAAGHAPAIAFMPKAGGKQTTLGFDPASPTTPTLGCTQEVAVCVTGDRTHALNAANNGKGCSEDGTGRGVPTVAIALRGREGGGMIEVGDEIQNALRASNGGGDKPYVFSEMAVRRLMPVECERLQGFGDDWTRVPTTLVSAKRQKEARALAEAGDPSFFVMPDGSVRNASADGQRYKQIGNSWAVDCINWIGARIDKRVRDTVEVTIGSKEADALSPWLTCP